MSRAIPALSVVIPAYNEESRLPATLEAFHSFLSAQGLPYEVIVVDDGSRDSTAAVVESAMARYPGLRLLRERHRGKGHAVRQGVLASKGEVVIFWDADLSAAPDQMPRFTLALPEGNDIAIGSREVAGAIREAEPEYRHLMGRVFNLLVQWLLVPGVQDTQCGLKAFTRKSAVELFRRSRMEGWAFDAEILFIARKRGYRIAEVPVRWLHQRSSRINPVRDTMTMFLELLQIRWNDLRGLYD